MNRQSGNPVEREFLGRKVFSLPQPSMPIPLIENPGPAWRAL